VNPDHLRERPRKPPRKKLSREERAEIARKNIEGWNNSPEGKAHARAQASPEHLEKLHTTWARSPENKERMRELGRAGGAENLRKYHERAGHRLRK
jgi:hypothetical protein